MIKTVTVWNKFENGKYSFNHIEDGWNNFLKPQPKSPNSVGQKAWANNKWAKQNAFQVGLKVIVLPFTTKYSR